MQAFHRSLSSFYLAVKPGSVSPTTKSSVGRAANNKLDFHFVDDTAALFDDFALGLTHSPLLTHRMRHLKLRYYALVVSDKPFLSIYNSIYTIYLYTIITTI